MVFTEEEVQEVHLTCRSRIEFFKQNSKSQRGIIQLVEYQTLEREFGIVMFNCEANEYIMDRLCQLIGWLTLQQNELPPNKRKMYQIEYTSFIEPK